MKNYIRSALDTLTALDFHLDHEDRKIRTDRWIFTHANAPDERLTLNFKMSEQAARTAWTLGSGLPLASARAQLADVLDRVSAAR